jgi:ATP-dependent Lon protease
MDNQWLSRINNQKIMEEDLIFPNPDDQDTSSNGNELQVVEEVLPTHLTILPLTQRPLFPGLTMPIAFSGETDLQTIKHVVEKEEGYLGLVYASDFDHEDPERAELSQTGTVFRIVRVMNVGPNTVQVLGQGISRFSKKRMVLVKPQLRWEVTYLHEPKTKITPDLKAYMMAISGEMKDLLKLNPLFQEQVNLVVAQLNHERPGYTMDIISNLLSAEPDTLQTLLETVDLHERAKMVLRLIKEELEVARIRKRINEQIEKKVNKQQKEFFLRQQLEEIKKELGIEKDDKESEVEKIQEKLKSKTLPEEVQKAVDRELDKLSTLNVQSPEFNVTRNYLETIADLPWGIFSEDASDIRKARKILDDSHYGLDDVKERILEFLSTVIRRGTVAGSILCLVGPPGVGKTSIGKSVAEALNRKFFRFSVGGMRDEAEIKGHRRTYIGAMPGKLIQSLGRVGTSNPVVMLDEIDKIGTGFRGDPASALLEVLDPEQNSAFLDHYLDVPYDLSNILFITTANQLDTIPGPLLDRMEIIRLSGYTLQEKVEIAKQYLVPKQLKENGFEPKEIRFTNPALKRIADKYAREAGVRNLEKQIGKIIRKVNLKLAEGESPDLKVRASAIEGYLGKPVFRPERLYDHPIPGVVLGLAYTSFGGATLYIEATGIPAKGPSFKRTGQLGKVMEESSEIAYSYVRALLGKDAEGKDYFEQHAVHLHVPAGATPKDGPSAGITMALALYSLATGKPVKDGLAMTGELTLTGRVLPIGGVKEKMLAAKRVGIQEILLPEENRRDYEELADHVKEGISVQFVDYFQDVLKIAYPASPTKKSK